MPSTNAMKSITCIVGARPNFMKIAPIMEQLVRHPRFNSRLIHTGQHFSPEMSDSFFRDLGIPEPDEYLGMTPGSQTEQTASIMRALEASFLLKQPGLVLVVGDVTSTLQPQLLRPGYRFPSPTSKLDCVASTAACRKKSIAWLPTPCQTIVCKRTQRSAQFAG